MFLAIDDKYDGPKLENGKVTLEFVKDLMETYVNQKKLHKKYAYKVKNLIFARHIYISSIWKLNISHIFRFS